MKKRVLSKFVIKLFWCFSAITITAILIASNFIFRTSVENIVSAEARVEQEVSNQFAKELSQKFDSLKEVVSRLYYASVRINDQDISVVETIRKPAEPEDYSKIEEGILAYLRTIMGVHSDIADLTVIDFKKDQVYFVSNTPYRSLKDSQAFLQSEFVQEVRNGGAVMGITDVYQPDYYARYNGTVSDVFSLHINLFDTAVMELQQPIGAIIMSIEPRMFASMYGAMNSGPNGQMRVVRDDGYVYYDSALPGEYGVFPLEQAQGKLAFEQTISKMPLRATNYVDTQAIEREVYDKIIKDSLGITLFIVAATFVVSLITSKLFDQRISRITRHIEVIRNGVFDQPIDVRQKDELGVIESELNEMCSTISENLDTIVAMELSAKDAELRSLQAQINPHFMYNTLESIRAMATIERGTQTARMVSVLGDLFRWNIKVKSQFVSLKKEFEFVRLYLQLQEIRFESSFEVCITLPQQWEKASVPKLILQPIVENAIYHGFAGLQKGILDIQVTGDEEELVILVRDNGVGMDEQTMQRVLNLNELTNGSEMYSIGVQNVNHRLKLMYGNRYGVEIESEIGKGTTVSVHVPLLFMNE